MKKTKIPFIFSFSIYMMSVTLALPVAATKLSAAPLPHRGDSQSINAQEIAPPLTRYNRLPPAADNQTSTPNNDSKNTADKNALIQKQNANKEELANAKSEKQRKLSALAANNKAVQLGQAGKFAEAIAAHEQATQLDPENKQFRINLSAAYCAYGQKQMSKNNFAAASQLFRQSIAAASDNALAGRLLVESLKKAGINPNSPDERLALGDQLLAQGDLASAGIEYQAAEQLEQSALTFVKMGDYVYQLGQTDLSANWYQQAALKDPEYGPAYRQLGFIYLSKGNQSQAASLLRKAVILDNKDKTAGNALVDLWHAQVSANPQIAENHLGLASALQLTGDLPGADLEYKKVAAIEPHHPALPAAQLSLNKSYEHAQAQRHKAAADTLWNQGLKQEALSEIAQAVRLEPKNTQYQFALGQGLETMGDIQGAHQAYLNCVLIDPENNQEAAGRLKTLQEAAKKVPQNQNQNTDTTLAKTQAPPSNANITANDTQTSAMLDKIQALEMAHNYDQAINDLKELVNNNLENSSIHHRLAIALMSNGEISEAISEFRIASALAPEQKIYASDLAQALTIHKQSLTKDEQPVNTAAGAKQ